MTFYFHFLLTGAVSPEDITPSMLEEWIKGLGPKLLDFGKTLLFALLVFFIGRKLIKWLVKLTERFLERSSVEKGVTRFLIPVVRIILNFLLIILIAGILKVETSSLIALLGSAGLALGLALQGSLSNFAGGLLILLLKPFRLGDYIISGNYEGTVTSIDIFYTRLLTVDNRLVVLPNGALSNSNVINVTNEPVRQLILEVSAEYSEQIKRVKDILYSIVSSHPLTIQEGHEVLVYVSAFEASSITLGVRAWVATENYWTLKWELLESIKTAFDREGIAMPFDQLDVNIKSGIN